MDTELLINDDPELVLMRCIKQLEDIVDATPGMKLGFFENKFWVTYVNVAAAEQAAKQAAEQSPPA